MYLELKDFCMKHACGSNQLSLMIKLNHFSIVNKVNQKAIPCINTEGFLFTKWEYTSLEVK